MGNKQRIATMDHIDLDAYEALKEISMDLVSFKKYKYQVLLTFNKKGRSLVHYVCAKNIPECIEKIKIGDYK